MRSLTSRSSASPVVLVLAWALLLAGCASPAPSAIATPEHDEPASPFRSAEEQARIPSAVADRRTPNVTAPLTRSWVRSHTDSVWIPSVPQGFGRIIACSGVDNLNDVWLVIERGLELYRGEPSEGTLVARMPFGPMLVSPKMGFDARLDHRVNFTDVAMDGADSRYVAHIWHEVLMPLEIERGWRGEDIIEHAEPTEPPRREDLWINITYSPLRDETYAGSEDECDS